MSTVTEVITPLDDYGWGSVFTNFPDVAYLEYSWDEAADFEDLTVFFKGSEEPFPLTSLKSDSPLKLFLKGLLAEE